MEIQGAGEITGPMLLAEIDDVPRFTSKNALVAFAGVDASPYQSGMFDMKFLKEVFLIFEQFSFRSLRFFSANPILRILCFSL